MRNDLPPVPESVAEVDDLRARLAEAEETLRAIGSGEADALVIAGSQGDEVQFLGSEQSAFRQLVEAVDQGTATLSADGVVLSCDASLARTLGRRVDELIGTSMAAYLSPEDYAELGDALALPEATSGRRRVRLVAANGVMVPVYLSTSILHGSEEQRVSCVVFTDLEEVFSAEEGLRESAQHYRELVEFAPVAIGVVAEGKIALINAAALRLLGADSAEQVIGRPAAVITHPDSLEDVQSRMRRMVSGEQGLFPARAVCLRLDGTRMDVEITASPVSLGGVAAIQVVIADVTERRRAEDEVRRLNTELEERVASRTTQLEATIKELEAFVYSVSHDLRAPLRAIDGFSQMVAEDAGEKLTAGDHEHLQRVRAAAQRMAQLIDQLLGLSRATRSELHIEELDLSALAKAVLADLAEADPERKVIAVVAPGLRATADATLLRAIFANLLGNAWKFTSKHESARIEVGAMDADGERAFYVRDDGAGFDSSCATHLFGAFQRMHAPGLFEGDGIGLATVQRLVSRHDGRVWAEAEVEKGATFYFTLPGHMHP